MTTVEGIDSNENIGRYLTQHSHFKKARNQVTAQAFIPPKDLELSVFRIEGLEMDEIWKIGDWVVMNLPEPRTLYGVGKIKAKSLEIDGTKLIVDEPPPNHCSVRNWPLEEARRLLIAIKMAAEATPVFK